MRVVKAKARTGVLESSAFKVDERVTLALSLPLDLTWGIYFSSLALLMAVIRGFFQSESRCISVYASKPPTQVFVLAPFTFPSVVPHS